MVVAAGLAAPSEAHAAGTTVGHSGWFWGTSAPQGNDLFDVDVAGSRAYAVGDFGTLLRSDDGGVTWSGLRPGTTTDLARVDVIARDSLVISGGCEVLRSDDGGATFRWLPVAADGGCSEGVRAVSFPTPSVGYVMSLDGTIEATTDGGASFERRTSVPTGRARRRFGELLSGATDLVFTGSQTGIATTVDGRILRTVDGARTWEEVAGRGAALNGLAFPDPVTGFAVGRDRRMLRTTDGGRSWSPVALAGAPAVDLGSIACADGMTCLISPAPLPFDGGRDYLVRTTDGGPTGATVSPSRRGLRAVDVDPSGNAVAVGSNGNIATSRDAGVRFEITSRLGGSLNFARVRAGSTMRAYAFDQDGALLATKDGGSSWTRFEIPASNVVDGAFPTAREGFALTLGGRLLKTEDGGLSWRTMRGRGKRSNSQALIAFSERELLVVGRGVRRSADGGRSFRTVRSRSIQYSDLTRADRAGDTVVVWHEDGQTPPAISHDRGRSWRRLKKPRGVTDFFELDFVNRRTGFLVDTTLARYRKVFVTHDAGRTWRAVRALGDNGIGNLAFSDARHGYVEVEPSGSLGGRLLRTSDGGRSWRPQPVAPGSVDDMVAPSRHRAYALYFLSDFFATEASGDHGAPSRIALSASTRRLRRAGYVTIRGQLRPAVAGARLVVARRLSLGWKRREVRTDDRGRFSIRWQVSRTAGFVAQWTGDAQHRAAGTRELPVEVGAPRRGGKRRSRR